MLKTEPWLLEAVHVLIIETSDQHFRGFIMFPRDMEKRYEVGGKYEFGEKRENVPAEIIPALIAKHRHQMRAL